MAASDRLRQTVADMGRSLGLVLAAILLLLVIGPTRTLVFRHHATPVQTVDYRDAVRGAATQLHRPVWSPTALPHGWRATSARVTGDGLHVGFLTPDGQYAAVEEAAGDPAAALGRLLGRKGAATVEGSVDAGGTSWTLHHDADGDRALVRRAGGLLVVVLGTARQPELLTLAASLRPQAG